MQRFVAWEPGTPSPHLKAVLGYMYAHGTADMEDVADALGITDDEAYQALEELTNGAVSSVPRVRTSSTPIARPHASSMA